MIDLQGIPLTVAPSRPAPQLQRPPEAICVFTGHLFKVWQWQQQLFDGSQTTFESLSRADTVTIIALDAAGHILITRQQQPAMASFVGLPGGVVDAGEAVLAAAQRELLEETGCQSDDWSLLFSSQPSGKIDWANFYLLARDCRQVAAQNLDGGERIKVEKLPLAQLSHLVQRADWRDREFALWWLKQ